MNDIMKRNLFTYATKELSQDAFLMWLFNNYDDEEVAPVVYALIREFCGLEDDEKIVDLHTRAQEHKIDISVYFETDKTRKYALFIEDKVDSAEHDQLGNYNKYSDLKDRKVTKVYYKTGYSYPDELQRVAKAGWKFFTPDEICNLLRPFANSENQIVRMYIQLVIARNKALSVTEKPERSETAVDFLKWLTFFNKTVIPHLEEVFDSNNISFGAWRPGQYPYICMVARYKDKENIPYLEIRSRDCLGGNFRALVLCYGMDDAFVTLQKELIERIEASELYESKNVHYFKKGKAIVPKQIGYTKKDALKATTTEEFIESVKIAVEAYLVLMKEWDK